MPLSVERWRQQHTISISEEKTQQRWEEIYLPSSYSSSSHGHASHFYAFVYLGKITDVLNKKRNKIRFNDADDDLILLLLLLLLLWLFCWMTDWWRRLWRRLALGSPAEIPPLAGDDYWRWLRPRWRQYRHSTARSGGVGGGSGISFHAGQSSTSTGKINETILVDRNLISFPLPHLQPLGGALSRCQLSGKSVWKN